MFSYLKFRLGRQMRRFRREIRMLSRWSANYLDRHIWGKWRQLGSIRRIILIWWGIALVALIGTGLQLHRLQVQSAIIQPVPGGRYTEGEVGDIKGINPILPDSSASSDASRLIFSGLLRYDQKRNLEPDLATSWQISPDGRTYTFKLRQGVYWHDGVPFTAQDVAFTLAAIQNPDSRSPLAPSWQGVKLDIVDDHTVTFTLPNAYPPFLDATTVGILPRHILESVEPSDLRTADFNQHPVGTGPFQIETFAPDQREVILAANNRYYNGRPQLDEFAFLSFNNTSEVMAAYAKHQVNAISRVEPVNIAATQRLKNLKMHEMNLPAETAVFFKTNTGVLADTSVRTALVQGINRTSIINEGLGGLAVPVSGPLLPGQLGYSAKYAQTGFNQKAASAALDAAGWVKASNGIRKKDGKSLQLRLVTSAAGTYPNVANLLKQQWKELGVDVNVVVADQSTLQQTYIRPRNYDMLLFAINIGSDPDVYSYWHSSQAVDPGLNLSGYASATADRALESGRINADNEVRTGKYMVFQSAWQTDNPALILYNPLYYYAVSADARGIIAHRLVDPTDRFYGIEHWTIRVRRLQP